MQSLNCSECNKDLSYRVTSGEAADDASDKTRETTRPATGSFSMPNPEQVRTRVPSTR